MASADAFPQLRRFLRSALPSLLRRLSCWKGLHRAWHFDVIEDLEHELVLDYLENRAAIDALPQRERHERWFRLLAQRHYQLRLRSQRLHEAGPALPELEARAPQCREANPADELHAALSAAELLEPDRARLAALLAGGDHHKNGRLNATASARALGVRPAQVRALWARLADALGYDEEFVAFWRQRLVEALVGLAADLLRDQRRVQVFGEARRARPDPHSRLRRIRRIKSELSLRPMAPDLKRALARFTSRGARHGLTARAALDSAAELAPQAAAVLAWSFEAAIADGELEQAARALRALRRCGDDPGALALARARLLEARGRRDPAFAWRDRARALLARRLARQHDLRLRIVAQRL
jgi:hypothetical protein